MKSFLVVSVPSIGSRQRAMSSSWDNWTATWSAPEPVAEQDSDAEIDYENVTSDVAAEELGGMLLELN